MKRTVITITKYPTWFTPKKDNIRSLIKHYTNALPFEYEIRFIFDTFDIIVYRGIVTKIFKIA